MNSSRIFLMALVFAVISAVGIFICICLWFRFKIPIIYNELSGKNAEKYINHCRKNNYEDKCENQRERITEIIN